MSEKCPACSENILSIGTNNNINNPFRLICYNYKYRYRTFLRKFYFSLQYV